MTKLIVALDMPNLYNAEQIIERVRDHCAMFSIGPALYFSVGMDPVAKLRTLAGVPVMLDLKLHYLPSVTYAAILPLVQRLNPAFLTVHAAAGIDAIKAAADATATCKTEIAAVTVLTSHAVSQGDVADLAVMAAQGGAGAIICSAWEVEEIRRAVRYYGETSRMLPTFIVPGVRAAGDAAHDQVRVAKPGLVRAVSADYAVVGRPITEAADPREAAILYEGLLS